MKVTNTIYLFLLNIFVDENGAIRATRREEVQDDMDDRDLVENELVAGATTSSIDRYYKEPIPRDVVLPPLQGAAYSSSTSLCALNGAGIYGSSQMASRIPIVFSYEVEIASDVFTSNQGFDESKIITDLEQAIGIDLANNETVCLSAMETGVTSNSRQSSSSAIVDVQGIGLLPVDQADDENACAGESVSCFVIAGEMSLYAVSTQNITAEIEQELATRALEMINANMASGKYNNGAVNPAVERVIYFSPSSEDNSNLSSSENNVPNNPTPTPPVGRDTMSQKAYGYVIIASCAVIAVIAVVFIRRKNHTTLLEERIERGLAKDNNLMIHGKSGGDDDDEATENITEYTGSKASPLPDLEISITDSTTDISTMGGSPCSSKDDSSLSSYTMDSVIEKQYNQNIASNNTSSTHNRGNRSTILPAPLLAPQDEDEKSYQDDELLFSTNNALT